eukprot:2383965-Karenia_brevis.AAC.1
MEVDSVDSSYPNPPNDAHGDKKRIAELANARPTWPCCGIRMEMRTISALNLDCGGSGAMPKHVTWKE